MRPFLHEGVVTMIYKSETLARHIDLSKILSISDAYFIDRMIVGFEIRFQLQDQPFEFKRGLRDPDEMRWHQPTINDRGHFELAYLKPDGGIEFHQRQLRGLPVLAVVNLQKEIDDLVAVWKKCVNYL